MLRTLVPAHFQPQIAPRVTGLDLDLVPYDKEGRPATDAAGASVLFRWWLSPEQGDRLLDEHPLRWIHTGSAGVDHILTPAFRRRNPVLTNSSGVHAPSIAEWVVLGMLAQEKGFGRMLQQQREQRFEKTQADELGGKEVVILGGGSIASEVATRLRPFGVRLTCVRRRSDPHPLFDRVATLDAVEEADWLIIALPLTEKTRRLVNRRLLERLPERCRIVNVARGEVMDEEALIEALRGRRVAGAVLDVFEQEPLPPEHPFWHMPEVIVLPHTTWRSPQVQERQLALFVENLRRFVAGEPLLNVVDVDAGY
jgi:phosphoglycerate dehydrogenase-like enzyme